MTVNKTLFNVKQSINKHSPAIYTAMGIVSILTGVVLAVKATKPALEHVKEADISEEDTKLDKAVKIIKVTWKDYVWPGLFIVCGTTSIICSDIKAMRHTSELANESLYFRTLYRNLEDKLEETLPKKKVDEIRDSIAEDEAREHFKSYEPEQVTNNGKHLFCDNVTGQFFRSTYEEVHQARETVRESANDTSYAKIGELHQLFGEQPCAIGEWFWISGSEIVNGWRETTFTINGEEATAIFYDLDNAHRPSDRLP